MYFVLRYNMHHTLYLYNYVYNVPYKGMESKCRPQLHGCSKRHGKDKLAASLLLVYVFILCLSSE